MTPFKRRYVDNWRKDVNRHLRAGTICKIVVHSLLPGETYDEYKQIVSVVSDTVKSQEISTQTSPRGTAVVNTTTNSSQQRSKFAYTRTDGEKTIKTERQEGVQCNGIRKTGHRANQHRSITPNKKESEEEAIPLVIIDPQLITPPAAQSYDTSQLEKRLASRPKTNERNANPFKFTSLVKQNQAENSQEKKSDKWSIENYQKKRDVWSIRCQVQSRDKNSFVVSRSNIIKYNGTTNHSFLNLPARFQTDKHDQQQPNFKQEVSLDRISSTVQPQKRNITAMFAVQAW